MKFKKVFAALLASTFFFSALAGCSSAPAAGASQGQSSAPANNGESSGQTDGQTPVTLRFSWWGGDARHNATLSVIKQFQEKYPWITIEAEYGAFDGYNEKMMTQFASQTAPDIMQIETGSGAEYYERGQLANLTELGVDFSKFDSNFLVNNGQFGSGSQYAIPTGLAGSAIIVNQDLAEKIGIDFTQQYDWAQLIEWGKKVQEYDPSLYLISGNKVYMTSFVLRNRGRQYNAQSIINDNNELVMTRDQFEETFTYIKELYDSKTCVPLSYMEAYGQSNQDDPNWIAGKYVSCVGYTSSADVLQAANPNAKYISGKMPLMTDGKSDGWPNDCPQYMGVYAKTKHPKEAAMFLDFFFNDAKAMEALGTVRSVPPTKEAQGICEKTGSLNPLTQESVNVSMSYKGFPDSGKATTAEVLAILADAYENVAYGAKTPAEQADEVVALLNDYLARQS